MRHDLLREYLPNPRDFDGWHLLNDSDAINALLRLEGGWRPR